MKKTEKKILAMVAVSGLLFFAVAMEVEAGGISTENVIKELNETRIFSGLPPLVKNEKLSKAAEEKIQDMVKKGYFEHTSPDGIEPWHWINKNGYAYTYAGENLAMDFKTAKLQQLAWMKSPTHRKNILNADFQEIGVAVGQGMIDGHMATITVQEFGARRGFPVLSQKGSGIAEGSRKSSVSGGRILGAQSIGLAALDSRISAYLPAKINNMPAIGEPGGWVLALFGLALSALGVATVHLAFDMYKTRKENKLADESRYHDACGIGDEEYVRLVEKISAEAMGIRKHHS